MHRPLWIGSVEPAHPPWWADSLPEEEEFEPPVPLRAEYICLDTVLSPGGWKRTCSEGRPVPGGDRQFESLFLRQGVSLTGVFHSYRRKGPAFAGCGDVSGRSKMADPGGCRYPGLRFQAEVHDRRGRLSLSALRQPQMRTLSLGHEHPQGSRICQGGPSRSLLSSSWLASSY